MAPKKWNRIFEKIQNKSGKEKITIVVLTGILLLVISLPTGSKSGQTETNENTQTRQTGLSESAKSYETVLEEKLEKALKKVEGVGEVSVVITLKNTSEKIYTSIKYVAKKVPLNKFNFPENLKNKISLEEYRSK